MEDYYIMWLNSVLNVSTETKYKLIDYFGSAKDVYLADNEDIKYSELVTKTEYNNIVKSKAAYDFEKEIKELEASPAIFCTYRDNSFPKQLREMNEPPLGLYIWGELPQNTYPYASIVGTRRASDYGCTVAHKLAYDLAEVGVSVVSGMAYGIDSKAHEGALDGGGKTVAVLGCGVDICYPSGNRALRDRIIENGCVISEFPLGRRVTKFSFPYRNRIIAALSSVVIIVEGEHKSGSLITARLALDNGRSVMAVPGNITSRLSQGTNKLIADGCPPVLSVRDILDEMHIQVTEKEIKEIKKKVDISSEEKTVYDLIDYEPITADEIALKLSLSIQIVSSLLMMLELKGCIMRMSGQKYVRSL